VTITKIVIISLFFLSIFIVPNLTRAENCGTSVPSGTPDLFQIDVQATSATVHFTPVSGSDYYFIAFGHMSGDKQYGANIGSGGDGVQSFKINFLAPNTSYTFVVRGGSGCAPGEWGNELTITTAAGDGTATNHYRYNASGVPQISAIPASMATSNMSKDVSAQTIPTSTLTPKPTAKPEAKKPAAETTPTPTKEQNCILGYCW
jgi:hypothetical protein